MPNSIFDNAETTELPEIWRLALRSGRPDMAERHTEQVDHCLNNGIAALGWEADNDGTSEDALRRIERAHSRNGRMTVERFMSASEGSLVWTLHTDGTYRLGEIAGAWSYDDSAKAHEFDCVQVRTVKWAEKDFDVSEVPGAVIHAFSGRGSSFSRIHNEGARRYSRSVFDVLVGRTSGMRTASPEEVLRSLLDPWDVEDLVAVYLQFCRKYLVLPASRQTATSGYEYVLIDPASGQHAIVQVKTGHASINVKKLASAARGDQRRAFAFSTEEKYEGADGLVETLTRSELLTFMKDFPKALPPKVSRWLNLA